MTTQYTLLRLVYTGDFCCDFSGVYSELAIPPVVYTGDLKSRLKSQRKSPLKSQQKSPVKRAFIVPIYFSFLPEEKLFPACAPWPSDHFPCSPVWPVSSS